MTLTPQYITDSNGKKISVILPIKEFEKLIEELEDIQLFDKAMTRKQEFVPLETALKEIEAGRKKKK